jgi:hypothetical protein
MVRTGATVPPASPFVPHAGAVRGFVFGVAAARLNEVT